MDIWINPQTGGYEISNGAPVRDPADGLANAVYMRLMTHLGSFWANPTLGSRLHELAREKDLARIELLARQYAAQALQPILDDGRATAIEIATERPHNGRLLLAIQITAASGRQLTFQHPVQVI
ncbi:MAG: phage GP46 family protein [Pseudomonadota bacterium]|nr:phage GP46 family protein [Pseudomonadota bacterium]